MVYGDFYYLVDYGGVGWYKVGGSGDFVYLG